MIHRMVLQRQLIKDIRKLKIKTKKSLKRHIGKKGRIKKKKSKKKAHRWIHGKKRFNREEETALLKLLFIINAVFIILYVVVSYFSSSEIESQRQAGRVEKKEPLCLIVVCGLFLLFFCNQAQAQSLNERGM